MMYSIAAIVSGAGIGALLRWFLGLKLNTLYPAIPIGTLSANILGGYMIGIAIAFFATNTSLSPEWKLFVITGFLGGLTTFSTFSAEIVTAIQEGRLSLAAMGVFLHVGGSLIMTFLWIASMMYLQNRGAL
ncbi:fluoride efflux transporter CrcB [Sulfuricurvum sp.]|uniref:fluoride efflux transporter CrcB n=1 Tax=Sulfuricurvum sp. TaxID=2025608 RepID=UPI0025F6B9A8|nr:fluoride efflux transporter CrcB [Sulfuricurvum sp.]